MKCDDMKEKLALFVSGDLPGSEIDEVRQHLDECDICKIELAELEKTYSRMKESGLRLIPKPLPSDFTDNVITELESEESGARWFGLVKDGQIRWRPILGISGLAAAAVILIVGLSFWKISRDMDRTMRETLQLVSFNTQLAVRMSEFIDIFDVPVNDPVKLKDWQPQDQAGVFAVLHKPDPEEKPETYVIDYCDEVRDLSKLPGYPWIKSRLKEFKSRTGSLDNVYVMVVPMPDSTPLERKEIQYEIIQKFKPVFNRERG